MLGKAAQTTMSGLMMDRTDDVPVIEVRKSQSVRLFDVLILGPAMLYLGTRNRPLDVRERTILLLAGTGIVVYNGTRWNETRKANRPAVVPAGS